MKTEYIILVIILSFFLVRKIILWVKKSDEAFRNEEYDRLKREEEKFNSLALPLKSIEISNSPYHPALVYRAIIEDANGERGIFKEVDVSLHEEICPNLVAKLFLALGQLQY
ncbi:hypothetical protein CL684_01215 [Candidatus Campbellbacteria bacterium]|nr:hypothetical protein [Candidatus Campbellbacteria bacterium]|tara:strand:- start:25 stop:360 length:336 start_codon:yes stop_codon:yes gene_type:complete